MKPLPATPRFLATGVLFATVGLTSLVATGCDAGAGDGSTLAAESAEEMDDDRLPGVETGARLGDRLLDVPPVATVDACPTAAVERFVGTASNLDQGAGSSEEVQADVTWTRVASNGCVDRYAPSGTATWTFQIGCCCDLSYSPGDASIAAADGELVVDRSTSPATYAVRGETRWETQESCPTDGDDDAGPSPGTGGGVWLDQAGTMTDGTIAGTVTEGSATAVWELVAEAAPVD